MTITPAIQVGKGSHLGWRALWLRGPEFALALVPEVGGRIMGIEWRGQQLAFAPNIIRPGMVQTELAAFGHCCPTWP